MKEASMAAAPKKDLVDTSIASKVEQIKALPYATSIVSEDVIERNFGYKIIRQQVSSGRNSMIYKCESVRRPDSFCLIKPYKQGKEKIKQTIHEETCQIMRYVTGKSPLIISTYDIFYTNEKIYVMCDWSQKGEVLSCLKAKTVRLTENVVQLWAVDILNAIQFLHNNAICHRNVAPSCLLLTNENRVKIGTMSDACIYCKPDGTVVKQKWTKFSRDVNWNQPPEVAKLKPFDMRRAEIWSIGATVFWFICRLYPIDYRSSQRLTKQLDYRMSFMKRVSRKCQSFVKQMLTFQPGQRPTLQQALEMEWITGTASPAPSQVKPSAHTPGSPEASGVEASRSKMKPSSAGQQQVSQVPAPSPELPITEVTPADNGEAAGPEEVTAAETPAEEPEA